MNTKTIAFQRALALLKASGIPFATIHEGQPYTSPNLQWAIKLEDFTFGNLELVQTRSGRGPAKSPRKEWAISTGYLAALHAMKPGDNWTYACVDKETAIAMQKTVSGRAGQLWGVGNQITTTDADFKLEVLRVA